MPESEPMASVASSYPCEVPAHSTSNGVHWPRCPRTDAWRSPRSAERVGEVPLVISVLGAARFPIQTSDWRSTRLVRPMRIILFAAASFAALRLEQLIEHDPRWMGKRPRITPCELAVLRLVSMGRRTDEIARALSSWWGDGPQSPQEKCRV